MSNTTPVWEQQTILIVFDGRFKEANGPVASVVCHPSEASSFASLVRRHRLPVWCSVILNKVKDLRGANQMLRYAQHDS